MEVYKFLYEAEPRDIPVYDASSLSKGALLQRGAHAGNSNSYYVKATTGELAIGILLEDVSSFNNADDGLTFAKAITAPGVDYLAEYSQDSGDVCSPSATSADTTIPITGVEENLDGGFVIDITDTSNVKVRYITASGNNSVTVSQALSVTTSSKLILVRPINHRILSLSSDATKLVGAAAAGSATYLIQKDILISADGIGGKQFLRKDKFEAMDGLTNVKVYGIIGLLSHAERSAGDVGASKLLVYPISADLTSASDVGTFDFAENIVIEELGIIVTTTVAADTTAPVVAIKNGTTELATLTIADGSAAKDVVKTTSISLPYGISAGDTLTFNVKTAAADSGTAAGAGNIYIRYR